MTQERNYWLEHLYSFSKSQISCSTATTQAFISAADRNDSYMYCPQLNFLFRVKVYTLAR